MSCVLDCWTAEIAAMVSHGSEKWIHTDQKNGFQLIHVVPAQPNKTYVDVSK